MCDTSQVILFTGNCGDGTNSGRNVNIPMPTLRFCPNRVKIRQVTYNSAGDAGSPVFQLVSNLVVDQVLAIINPDISNLAPMTEFILYSKPAGTYYFQVQEMPTSGTGPGAVTTTAIGVWSILLEFYRVDEK